MNMYPELNRNEVTDIFFSFELFAGATVRIKSLIA